MSSAALREGHPSVARAPRLRYLALVLGIAFLYAATGRLGLLLAETQQNATLIWAPTGLALAALVLFGARHWPGVLLGAALTNASIGTPALPLVAITVGNTLEALVGWLLLTRVARLHTGFDRLRDVLSFLLFGVLLSTTVSATVGVSALYLCGQLEGQSPGVVWLIWWLGDAGGAAVVAPLLMVGLNGRPAWRALGRKGETWAALLALGGLIALAFGGVLPEPWQALLFALLAFPVVVWVGLRLGPRGAVLGSFVAGTGAVLGTARGGGPFVGAGVGYDFFLLWAYVFSLGTVAMILAAAIAEAADAAQAQHESDRERAHLADQLQHSHRLESLGLLAGGIAHDFNNLLMVVRGNAELLQMGAEPSESRELLGSIRTATDQAADLCRQLLTYAGKSRPERSTTDLRALVDEMGPLLETSIAGSVRLRFETDAVPAILADRTQLRQVLMNLVLNAAQATEGEGSRVDVSLATRELSDAELRDAFPTSSAEAGRFVVLRVEDDGVGMSPEVRERIFDPFFTTKPQGRGLGMPGVLGIVRAHGGAILVRSAPGEGSRFEICFPALEGVAAPAPEPPPAPASGPRTAVRILFADDNEHVRTVTRILLEGAGYTVALAKDGAEAVARFETEPDAFDVLLFDVKMPRMTGPEALVRIRARAPGFPAVLMSGFDAGLTQNLANTVVVQKPFEVAALLSALEEVLEARAGRASPQSARASAAREGGAG